MDRAAFQHATAKAAVPDGYPHKGLAGNTPIRYANTSTLDVHGGCPAFQASSELGQVADLGTTARFALLTSLEHATSREQQL